MVCWFLGTKPVQALNSSPVLVPFKDVYLHLNLNGAEIRGWLCELNKEKFFDTPPRSCCFRWKLFNSTSSLILSLRLRHHLPNVYAMTSAQCWPFAWHWPSRDVDIDFHATLTRTFTQSWHGLSRNVDRPLRDIDIDLRVTLTLSFAWHWHCLSRDINLQPLFWGWNNSRAEIFTQSCLIFKMGDWPFSGTRPI